MLKSWIYGLAALVALVAVPTKNVLAVPGDYDGDGRADIALIDADQPEDKTTVFVRQSSDNQVVANIFYPFGDYVISGNFFGGAKSYAGIVSKRTRIDSLRWQIKNPNGGEKIFSFGVNSDIVAKWSRWPLFMPPNLFLLNLSDYML
jgi:hypothetical protein